MRLADPKTDSMYHAGWAWAGDTPFHYTKLIASHFGGTRNPMAMSWPANIKPDKTPRPQFHHVNDIAPTIYEILGIKPPKVVDGFAQDPIDGVSMVYTFASATAPTRKHTQYFDNNGSRGIYHDGWYRLYLRTVDTLAHGESGTRNLGFQRGRLGTLRPQADFSQANDLASKDPNVWQKMKTLFLKEAEANKVFPIGAGSGCAFIRKTASRRLTRPGNSTRRRGACRSSLLPGLAARAITLRSIRVGRERIRRPLLARRSRRRPDPLSWTRANSSTNTT